jgi:hypothetical protein
MRAQGRPTNSDEIAAGVPGFGSVVLSSQREELETISRSFHAAAGLDANTVNNRPSFVRPARIPV